MWKANVSGASSLIFAGAGFLNGITWHDLITGLAAIITASFAAYNYYWAAQERRLNMRIKLEEHEEDTK